MAIKKQITKTITDQQRIEFAKQIEHFYEAGYANRRKILTFTFLKGVVTGFGVFLGGTIIVGALLWALSQLNNLPFIGNLTKTAEQNINEAKQQ
jgi:cell division septal protein FtsQ